MRAAEALEVCVRGPGVHVAQLVLNYGYRLPKLRIQVNSVRVPHAVTVDALVDPRTLCQGLDAAPDIVTVQRRSGLLSVTPGYGAEQWSIVRHTQASPHRHPVRQLTSIP